MNLLKSIAPFSAAAALLGPAEKPLGSLNFLREIAPPAVVTRAWRGLCGLFAPPIIQDAGAVEAEFGLLHAGMVRFHVLHDVSLGLVLIRRRARLVNSWRHESILRLRDRRLS